MTSFKCNLKSIYIDRTVEMESNQIKATALKKNDLKKECK